jgi:hypothetical protein
MPRSGFKGDMKDNSDSPTFDQCIFADPYPREEQANFAKWFVMSCQTLVILCLTLLDSDAMCPGNDILVFFVDCVTVVEIRSFKAPNTLWTWVEPTRSRLAALWRCSTRHSMSPMRQLVSDMFQTTATTSVVKIL